ncbi:MAG: ribonucleoside-diphosphate reductase subunit alpha [Pseudomonadota bacterium]|nr:ribonucleoside-diphosphate reductase subunit alpha [Pseudomonadota bacterium]
MQLSTDFKTEGHTILGNAAQPSDATLAPAYPDHKIIRRNGAVVAFEPGKIAVALTKAFIAVNGGQAAASARIRELVENLTDNVVNALIRRQPNGGTFHIEDIQDQVELALMRSGEHEVARAYVLYREKRNEERAKQKQQQVEEHTLFCLENGERRPLDLQHLAAVIGAACEGLTETNPQAILQATLRDIYDGVPMDEVRRSLILSARSLIEKDPEYNYVTSRLLMHSIRREVLGEEVGQAEMATRYADYFTTYIQKGIEAELLDERLRQFDLPRLAAALDSKRDLQFQYLGLQTLYDRYFLHIDERRIELPQAFFMRVAMGLSLNEIDREARALEFYEVLSRFDYMSSTPTLFNAGTRHSQLSSCYLTTIPDDLDGIYQGIKENALLQKFAGGIGNDWTRVRSLGAYIKGTNGKSQGVVPFLKVANDTAVAVNQCFAPDTLIHTADGVKAIRDVKQGDLVLGISGTYREVKKTMLYNQRPQDPMVALDVKHSIEPMKVTAGHPFRAIRGVPLEQANNRTDNWLDKGKVKVEWVEAGQLSKGDYVAQVIPSETVVVAGFDEEDARLYGILLGDGHLAKDGMQWGVSGNPSNDAHLAFVRDYLAARGIHYWETGRGETYAQVHWASGRGVLRNASNGRIVSAGAATLPFDHDDLYNAQGEKRIARRFNHLPRTQTLALLQGLLETDGGVSRGKEIYFTNTSRELIEGVRYQCLRLGVPTAGQYRERDNAHTGTRSDGSRITFNGISKSFDLRIPAVPEIAMRVGCQPIEKHNWLTHNGCVFSRVRGVENIPGTPFVFDLLVEGDESYMTTAGLAHNGGKRKGAVCAFLETWHMDIEEFLELRKNTGDDRRRTHDMNTANWVPDLFMKRVMENAEWTLFSPSDTPDLHDLFGQAFEAAYTRYEEKAARGELKVFKKVAAVGLWRKMISMLFETGHPWITFKDACNVRYTNQHVGVVHSSNPCTENTLHTHDNELAVCNLGSVNLANHVKPALSGVEGSGALDLEKLQKTIRIAMRMLDNVIDINFYNVGKARNSNLKHRPVGLGTMAFQDALHLLRIPYASDAAVEFADRAQEAVAYFAYSASADLAEERGRYNTFNGSLWSQGILPQDSLKRLAVERGGYLEADLTERLDWDALRNRIMTVGMRNSNCLAIAPTATIANIVGVSASIEPTYQNLFVKSNLSGEFTVVNQYLVRDLKALNLWDEVMVGDIKYFDGSLAKIDRIPAELRSLYATAFEVDPSWLIEAGARRQKWIDQAQSLNLYFHGASGKKLDETYKLAWIRGLKTTYYLRSLGATAAEKSTGKGGELNAVSAHSGGHAAASALPEPEIVGRACTMRPGDPGFEECEACQ